MNCKICNEEMHADRYVKDVKAAMLKHQMCHTCNFWREMLERDAERPSHTWCVINGVHYVIEPDDPKSYFQGFGGREFQIEFNDSHRVVTHNLWCQGEPEGYWKDKFPDNARFENNEKWVKIDNTEYLI